MSGESKVAHGPFDLSVVAGRQGLEMQPAELTVVVPTYNECANVRPLLVRLMRSLAGISFEILVVDDDSPDGTADQVRALAARDARVRCLQRIGRRGLSSACVEGMLASSSPFLAVIDADLQHQETLLRQMLEVMRRGETDIVIGSRYLEGPAVPGWGSRRTTISRISTWLGRLVLPMPVTDPMSGFFMISREAFHARVHHLSGIGFKILLDLLMSSPRVRLVELPYRFRNRLVGESKLDSRAAMDFIMLLVDKSVGRWVPARFVAFSFVGGLGVLVHFAALLLAMSAFGVDFVPAQAVASLVAMTFNFALNNELTYRDRRLRGSAWLKGWLSFCLACGVGAIANVGVAAELFLTGTPWLPSALGGVLVGAVWNYAVTAWYTWDGSASSRRLQ
jgi:dolichol-phosphate mannosyltransferase